VLLHTKHALIVKLANGATPLLLHHTTHVEDAHQADGVQVKEQTQKMFAHPAVVV